MKKPPGSPWYGAACRVAWLAACATLASPCTWAGDIAVLHRVHASRLAGADLPSLAALSEGLLAGSGSAYSAIVSRPDFTNDIAWIDFLDSLPGQPGEAEVIGELALELGLTRARPGKDVPDRPGYRDPLVAANATKAGVDPDIFWHMLDLGGFRHSARTAGYAVALQALRRQIAAVPTDRHVANGIDASVLARVMAARYWDDVTPYDMDYLGNLAQSLLIRSHVPTRGSDGTPLPPTAYRVARLAAAWRDTEGYFTNPPCDRNGTPREPAREDAMLCFVGANDRAVHAWYIDELRRQALLPTPDAHKSGVTRLLTGVALLMPLLDIAALAEVVEAAIADDVAFDGMAQEAEAAEQRAAAITCRLRG
ncbi:hypothetical protein L2Y96_02480 [Luteibacter aegosomaticola]|uniref:hypothetical protein n=1 Tax=Luteibacter aegosomaticola TaxID=2911538 RepID=UPI001FF79CFE|nr:hypothetical protein [Luteibacter aegosomaticola]UPG90659.1 hypothetical protein L2Y96_02480 [Luteibacter aegosomaticola]